MRSQTKPVATSSSSSSSSSKNNNPKQEQPHLSGAYIRSLVKQLSSSSTSRSKDHHNSMITPHDHEQQAQQEEKQQQEQAQAQAQAQPHKKQVRRRLHTSRPYQERLLNMAEARREIVTALKIHRATMRQAKEQQQQQQQQQLQLLQLQKQQQVQVLQEQSQATEASAHTPISYASFSNYLYNSPLAHFSTTSTTPIALAPMVGFDHGLDHLATLPSQPLGLNLSFQGFSSAFDDAKNSKYSYDHSMIQPSPASSYSAYSSPSVAMAGHEAPAVDATEKPSGDASLHRVLDDEEMAAIYSIGERHDIEWSDTVNAATSAWWSKLLESMEGGSKSAEDGGAVGMTDDVSGVPEWLCDSLGHQQGVTASNSDALDMHLGAYYHHGGSYGEDVTLPCMDIGEIEGWNGDWFP